MEAVLLLDLLLDLVTNDVGGAVVLESGDGLVLGLVFNDLLLLAGCVGPGHVFQGNVAAGKHPLRVVKVGEFVNSLDSRLDELTKADLVIVLLLLAEAFLLDLIVVEATHLESLVVFALRTVLIVNLVLDHVVQGEDVPGVVGFRLHLPFSARL